MASRIVKSPAVQSTARRQYGQAAVARTEREFVKSEPLKVSTLPNGLTVASIENHSPVTTLGVAIKVRLCFVSEQSQFINPMLGWVP